MPQNKVYEVEFPFVVDGVEPVIITDILPSCGCTDVSIRADWNSEFVGKAWPLSRPIPAGSAGRIVAVFHSSRYSSEKNTVISVRGDFLAKAVELKIIADVIATFQLTPSRIDFGEVTTAPASQDVQVSARTPFKIIQWETLPPGISVEELGGDLNPSTRKMTRNFRLTLSPGLVGNRIASHLRAETDVGADIEIQVTGATLGAIRYTPPKGVSFGIMPSGVRKTKTVSLVSLGPNMPAPSIEITASAINVMTAKVVEIRPGQEYEISVTVAEDAEVGHYQGYLHISFPTKSGLKAEKIYLNARIR